MKKKQILRRNQFPKSTSKKNQRTEAGQKKKKKNEKSNQGTKKAERQPNCSNCVEVNLKFVSRIKKAANLERQAKRIEAFKKIVEKKTSKVYISSTSFFFD